MSKSDFDAAVTAERKRETRAAWRVLLKRPLVLFILLTMFPLIPALLGVFAGGSNGSLRSNVPRYAGSGRQLRSTKDFRRHFESGKPDKSIVGLDFRLSASIDHREGSSYLMLRRVRSGASGPQIAESIPFEDAAELMLQFPDVQWIRFTGQQLRKTSPAVLNQLRKLETIEFNTTDVHFGDIQRLSQVLTLRHIRIRALSCDVDLSVLKRLPSLQSVHLTSESMSSSDEGKQRLLSRRCVAELAQLPQLEELILESRTLPADYYIRSDRLSGEESQAVAQFAESLSPAGRLKTLYVGLQNNSRQRAAMRQLKAALPAVSVHPAWYNFELGGMLGISCFACVFCLGLSGVHFLSCCSLPQTGIVPGVESAHLRVFRRLVVVAMLAQFMFLYFYANAHPLPVVAISLTVTAMALMVLRRTYVEVAPSTGKQSYAFGVLIGIAPGLLMFGAMGLTDRLEWFMCGEQPFWAALIIVVAGTIIYRTWTGLHSVYRYWAENGLEPAAAMQEFTRSVNSHRLKSVSVSRLERIAAAWSDRLQALGELLHTAQDSFIIRMRLWLIGAWQVSLSQAMFRMALLIPALCLPMAIMAYVKEGVLPTLPPYLIAVMVGYLLLFSVSAVGISLYGRYSMFADEIMRPVRRSAWRDTALVSTLLLSMILGVWSWLIVFAMRFTFGQSPDFVWSLYSFSATVAFCVIGAALSVWIVIVRRVLFTMTCLVLLLATVVPVVATLTEGRGPTGAFDPSIPPPVFWVGLITAELCLGTAVFAFAWRHWMKIELAES